MIRRYLVTGFFTLFPSLVTFWTLRAIFNTLTTTFYEPVAWLSQIIGLPAPPYWELALISIFATLLLLFTVGILVGNFVGIQILHWLDELVMHVPIARVIYGSTKQLMNAIQNGKGGSFKDVVIVEWPNHSSYTLGFVANENCHWTTIPNNTELIAVYIPTAPNPTSGYVVLLNKAKIKPTNISPEEVLTWAISGGVVTPRTHNS